jgi:hypothetical protein
MGAYGAHMRRLLDAILVVAGAFTAFWLLVPSPTLLSQRPE